jgi:hypothetical protein
MVSGDACLLLLLKTTNSEYSIAHTDCNSTVHTVPVEEVLTARSSVSSRNIASCYDFERCMRLLMLHDTSVYVPIAAV